MSPTPLKLTNWTKAHKKSKSHSAQVRVMRILIPGIAGGILLALFLWSPVERLLSHKEVVGGVTLQDLTLRNVVTKPSIHGLDKEGRPYHLQAHEAQQMSPDKAHLVTPHGKIDCENNMKVDIVSKTGFYQGNEKILTCEKDVHVTTSDGYILDSDKAHLHFNSKQTQGEGAVHAKGPAGTIQGNQGYTLTQEGHLHVHGPSKMTLNTHKDPAP
ncbi:MAG: LPS export ABC transporter periplasmic protein LptC [Alphaproteobacteria bacterium]|nr:LPS export ABC transporter periplasmic protein LptC [Alphaproteobacteria bacterium]